MMNKVTRSRSIALSYLIAAGGLFLFFQNCGPAFVAQELATTSLKDDSSGTAPTAPTPLPSATPVGALVWYSGIAYNADNGVKYTGCDLPTEETMNDESVGDKLGYGSESDVAPFITADLMSVKTVSAIRVGGKGPSNCWGSAAGYWNQAGSNISIIASPDGSSWVTVATGDAITYSNTEMQNIVFPAVSARYIKIVAPGYWLALGQFRVGN